ncbi:unnamed protein product, partial [Prorocentrum cordatum]
MPLPRQALSATIETDFHRTTVASWEKLLAAPLLARSRSRYLWHYEYDAYVRTQRRTVCDEKVSSFAIYTLRADAANSAVASHHHKARVAEVSAFFYHAPPIDEKDVGLPGLPASNVNRMCSDTQKVPLECRGPEVRAMFLKQIENVGARTWIHEEPEIVVTCSHLEIWIFPTDAGGDQQGAEGIIQREFDSCPFRWKLRSWCLHHQLHLVAAKNAEAFFKTAGMRELAAVLKEVFVEGDAPRVDADALEEGYGAEEAHDVKLGRWMRQTLRSVSDIRFWQVLYIKSESRAPITGMHFWPQKYTTDINCVLELVVRNIAADEGNILAEVVSHVLDAAGGFQRRFVVWKDTFPRRLVLFIAARHDEDSGIRRGTAAAMLALTEEEARADDLTHKFRTLFEADIQAARDNGTCSELMWGIVRGICTMRRIDTREIEGLNNTLKTIGRIAPRIGWEL